MKSDNIFFAFIIFAVALIASACNQAATSSNNTLEDTLIASFERESVTRSSIIKETGKPLAVNFDKSNMVWVPTGSIKRIPDEFLNAQFVPELQVKGFWLDEREVSNAEFALFVEATGYQTIAERALDPTNFPTVPLDMLVPGSFVITPQAGLENFTSKREGMFVAGANWRNPTGPSSTIKGKDSDAVVQIAYVDAVAYAEWIGKRLPRETELRYAMQEGYFVRSDQLVEYHFSSSAKKDTARASNMKSFLCVGDAME